MKAFVPTPEPIVDLMVGKLFRGRLPTNKSTILDPGCGRGAFVSGVVRWCEKHSIPMPSVVGIDSNPEHAKFSARRFAALNSVEIRPVDFLSPTEERFDYIIGNPPYVPLTGLSDAEREGYRRSYATATRRFDLYLLFFEQALSMLTQNGRLVFITPEKFLYVDTARPLRELLAQVSLEELHFVGEDTFGELVTYPLITTATRGSRAVPTRVVHRDGQVTATLLGPGGSSWLPAIHGHEPEDHTRTLADVCLRISCGVATGADGVFVVRDAELDERLRPFARPTVSGRQLRKASDPRTLHSLLVPYSAAGELLAEHQLGELGIHLADPVRQKKLLARTCTARKPWYAFHETPPLNEVLRPKLLCKDITPSPFFVADRAGNIIPRHSVYYLVPADPKDLDVLEVYLNSAQVQDWLRAHCQRAANGYFRLQSHVLKRLPIPQDLKVSARGPSVGKRVRLAQPA